jgi:hypothetical protein
MATINATLNITSNILGYPTAINKSMTMKKAGSCHGLEESTGLATRKYASTDQVDMITVANESASTTGANKLYVRNTGSSKVNFFRIGLGASAGSSSVQETEEIGRLYGGDWMLIPYLAEDANWDVMVKPSTAEEMTLEYMLFHE